MDTIERRKKEKTKRALAVLKQHSAPNELVVLFQELTEINDDLPDPAPIDDLLLDACQRFNFNAPFVSDGTARHFRARLIDRSLPEFADDGRQWFSNSPNLGSEQSYRRGYDQGFAAAREMIKSGKNLAAVEKREREIHAWRVRRLQIVGSEPGSIESSAVLSARSAISPKTRYKVFERDSYRCQICGRSQHNHVQLNVDHKISVADGGSSQMDNLQVLCAECNLGKSSSSM